MLIEGVPCDLARKHYEAVAVNLLILENIAESGSGDAEAARDFLMKYQWGHNEVYRDFLFYLLEHGFQWNIIRVKLLEFLVKLHSALHAENTHRIYTEKMEKVGAKRGGTWNCPSFPLACSCGYGRRTFSTQRSTGHQAILSDHLLIFYVGFDAQAVFPQFGFNLLPMCV